MVMPYDAFNCKNSFKKILVSPFTGFRRINSGHQQQERKLCTCRNTWAEWMDLPCLTSTVTALHFIMFHEEELKHLSRRVLVCWSRQVA
ncbi:hypothetical protein J6590_079522 [Homalodisca vitripennis]|nr:hypothetical protein J6590_079522 [Homalodisca vitripennis]